MFRLVRNHVLLRSELTGNPLSDGEKLSHAIEQGQFYMSLDILAEPKGFNAYIETAAGEILPMGSEVKFPKGHEACRHLCRTSRMCPFDTMIIHNGEKMMTSNSQRTEIFIHDPGVYRVEVRVIPTFPLPDGKKVGAVDLYESVLYPLINRAWGGF